MNSDAYFNQSPWWNTPTAKAVYSGLLLAASFPPLPLGFLAYLGIIPFLFALKQTRGKHGFRLGYIAGLFYAGGAAYWIGANTGTYLWAAVLSAVLAVAAIAVNYGLFGLAMGFIYKKGIPGGFWWAIPLWVASEFFRSFGVLVFPWLSISLSQAAYLPVTQIASITGMYGISAWVAALNVVIYYYLSSRQQQTPSLRWILIGAVVYLIPVIYGVVTLQLLPGPNENTRAMRVSVIQPNVDPTEKNSRNSREVHFQNLLNLSERALLQQPEVIVWPETATPPFIRYNMNGYRTRVQAWVDSVNIPILTGTVDWEPATSDSGDGEGTYYNSAIVFEPQKGSNQVYRKMNLVPFAEHIPFPGIFGFFSKLELNQGNYVPGEKFTVFEYANSTKAPMSVAICYDSSFPRTLREFRRRGAEWMAIITNDAWFGNTSGPYQHAQWAKIRAIENRVSIARSANTGISMIIDPWGRVDERLPLNSRGTITNQVFYNLTPPFYVRHGDIFIWILSSIGVLGLVWSLFRK